MKNEKILNTLVPLLGFMLFFIQGDSFAASPLLPDIADDFSISISAAGLTAVSYMLPFALFTIIFGPLGDRFGKMKLITAGAFGTTLFSALGGLAPNLLILCIFRAFNGIFAAAIMPVSMALIGELSGNDKNRLQASLGKTMALMFLGGAVAPVIGGAISNFASWRMVYLAYGGFELILSLLIISLISYKDNARRDITVKSAYKGVLSNRQLVQTVLIMSLLGLSVMGVFTYLGKFIRVSTGFSPLQAGLVLSLYGLGSLTGGRIGANLKARLAAAYVPAAALAGLLSLLSLAFFTSIAYISISLFLLGLSFMLIQPMLLARAQSLNERNRGTVMSMASFNMSIGGGVGTLLYGIILIQYDYKFIFLTGAIFFVILTATLIVSQRRGEMAAA